MVKRTPENRAGKRDYRDLAEDRGSLLGEGGAISYENHI